MDNDDHLNKIIGTRMKSLDLGCNPYCFHYRPHQDVWVKHENTNDETADVGLARLVAIFREQCSLFGEADALIIWSKRWSDFWESEKSVVEFARKERNKSRDVMRGIRRIAVATQKAPKKTDNFGVLGHYLISTSYVDRRTGWEEQFELEGFAMVRHITFSSVLGRYRSVYGISDFDYEQACVAIKEGRVVDYVYFATETEVKKVLTDSPGDPRTGEGVVQGRIRNSYWLKRIKRM
jgi:hypothetical protein